MAGGRIDATPGSRPCEPYHARKQRSIEIWRSRAYRARAKALPAMAEASSRSARACASETKAASNCEAARKTPPSSMAWKKRPYRAVSDRLAEAESVTGDV